MAVHFAVSVGKYQAKNAIRSRFPSTERFVFEDRGTALDPLKNQELILVLAQDSKYYVLALPEKGTPRRPTPIVIAADEIVSAAFVLRDE